MKINAHNYYNAFINKFAQNLMKEEIPQEEFSTTQTNTHTIQIKKIGLLGELPPNITTDMWTTPQTAQKLQQWH